MRVGSVPTFWRTGGIWRDQGGLETGKNDIVGSKIVDFNLRRKVVC